LGGASRAAADFRQPLPDEEPEWDAGADVVGVEGVERTAGPGTDSQSQPRGPVSTLVSTSEVDPEHARSVPSPKTNEMKAEPLKPSSRTFLFRILPGLFIAVAFALHSAAEAPEGIANLYAGPVKLPR
jgi:hypothetical protein